MLEIRNVSKSFDGNRVLKDVSLTIKQDGTGCCCSLIDSQYIFVSEIHVISLYNQ